MFGLTSMATTSPKGQIYPNYSHPKEDVDNLKNLKGVLEELAAEYGFTKPFLNPS